MFKRKHNQMGVTLLDNATINLNEIKAVLKIFPPARVIKNKVVKDNRSHNHFCRARGGQVCDLRVHQGEPETEPRSATLPTATGSNDHL